MARIITNDDFVNACNYLVSQGQLQVSGVRVIRASERVVYDETDHEDGNGKKVLSNITPDTPTLETTLDNALIAITGTLEVESALSDLQFIKNKAEKVADDIKELALAIVLSDEAGDGLAARLTAIGTALQDSKPGFQSAFLVAFNAEYGIDVLQGNTVTLDVGILALTTAQRRNLITFTRNFLPMYVILLRL